MSDLEQRVADALAHGAQEAPSAIGLAGAARSRARRRRRTRVGAVAAAVALCIAVPAAVVAARSSDPGEPAPSHVASDGASDRAVPAGQRVESWHSVTILVPDSWGHGSLSDWCADEGTLEPRVQRPGTITLDIACTPGSTYGVTFQQVDNHDDFVWPVVQQPGSDLPDGAWEGARGIGGVLVSVIAPTQGEALDVLATMRAIGREGDLSGCPSSSLAVVRPPDDGMSVCRYDEGGQLEQSELLDADDARTAEQAVRTAPLDTRRGPPCIRPHAPSTTIRMVSSAFDATVSFGGSCWFDTRVTSGVDARMLDSTVLYWALSPGWSGSVPEGVSLPSELRTD
jgi:hypothetical protein